MEEKLSSRLERLGATILNASRSDLYLSMRFLDLALGALDNRMYLGTRTVGTDGISILYHPRHLAQLYQDDPVMVNRCYLHMVLHCIFRHMMYPADTEPECWNLACDIAVESVMDSFDSKAVEMMISDYRREVYEDLSKDLKVLTAEGIYRILLRRQLTYQEMLELKREFHVCDHDIWEKLQDQEKEKGAQGSKPQSSREEEWGQDSSENMDSPDQDSSLDQDSQEESSHKKDSTSIRRKQEEKEQLEQEWKDISEKTQTNLETFARNLGADFSGLTRALAIENRTRTDYKEFLRRFAVRKEVMKEDPDEFDYGYYTYGLNLYRNLPLIEPLEYREEKRIENFVIVIDTSGSCSGKLVKAFLQESFQILKNQETFAKKVNLHILQCDEQVQSVAKITSQEELAEYEKTIKIKGFGGTDFRPAIDYVNHMLVHGEIRNLKGLLYFTDGYGTYPSKRPAYDVAFVFMGEEYSDAMVPPWAMKLVIETGGLTDEY